MAFTLVPGQRTWSGTRDSEGHRIYKLTSRMVGNPTDGPANALRTPGLYVVGAIWDIMEDVDIWAWCRADAVMNPVITDEPGNYWEVEQTFSTKPPDRKKSRCQDLPIEDPLLEPPKLSGSFVNYTEEASYDRFGKAITSSSFELMRGPQVEFDKNRSTVVIEKNYPLLALPLVSSLIDCVNGVPLWGFDTRKIKLTSATWERKYIGSCTPYYTWKYSFDIRNDAMGFDRDLLDEGSKALRGEWDPNSNIYRLKKIAGALPDPTNPNHFDRFKDRNGENCRVVLNGFGLPADTDVGTGAVGTGSSGSGGAGTIHVEKYDEADFSILGIPLILESI